MKEINYSFGTSRKKDKKKLALRVLAVTEKSLS